MTIENMGLSARRNYFSSDMISVLICYGMTNGENYILTLIHFIVHSTAVLHLYGFESYFYGEVFKLAEMKTSAMWISAIYFTLTMADIFCHIYNIYLLGSLVISKPYCSGKKA